MNKMFTIRKCSMNIVFFKSANYKMKKEIIEKDEIIIEYENEIIKMKNMISDLRVS